MEKTDTGKKKGLVWVFSFSEKPIGPAVWVFSLSRYRAGGILFLASALCTERTEEGMKIII
jgi:hypothetical protein